MNKSVQYLEIPNKSQSDSKHYKTLALPNGLKALLISDPIYYKYAVEDDDTYYGAVALLIDCGSFTDPCKYHGLAHFLENMICLGSKKFPTGFEFYGQIEELCGETYSYTENNETIYHFQVSEKHLDMCLDSFADQFKEPLLLKETMRGDRSSFDTEPPTNILVLGDEKHSQLLCNFTNSNDPFNTLEKDDINNDNLHKQLLEFYQRYYSANRMYVAIQAGLPMDELETLVIKHFADMPSNNLPGKDFSMYDYREAFTTQFHEEVLFVKAAEREYKLELTWILPPIKDLNKCKPETFLCFLFKNEGEGSLYAYLKKRLWIININAYAASNPICTLFKVALNLTFKGFRNLDDVIRATFAYVQLLRPSESLKTIYEELSTMRAYNFRFAEINGSVSAFENVKDLVENFKYYSAKDILAGPLLIYEYAEDHIAHVFKHFNEFNFNITVTSKENYNNDIKYDKTQKFHGTKYTSMKIPQNWHDLWYNCTSINDIYLPKSNQFVSNDFRIFWLENDKPQLSMAPQMLVKSDLCELWFRQDDKFLLPKADMNFYFISPLLRQNPMNAVLCDLYVKLVLLHLSEKFSAAKVAGFNFKFQSAEKGIILMVHGFNDKLPLVVELFSKAMVSISHHISEFQLDLVKKDLKKTIFVEFYYSEILSNDILSSIVKNIYWSTSDKHKLLNKVTLDNIKDFALKFRNELYVRCLMQGNLTQDIAQNVLTNVIDVFRCESIKEIKYIEDRCVELPKGSNFIRCRYIKDTIEHTITKNFYEISYRSVRIDSILQLLMKIINEPFVDAIRGKYRLTYTHSYGISLNYGIIGYHITLNTQAARFEASYVEERIEAFRNTILQIIQELSQEEMDKFRNLLIKTKQVPDKSLNEEFSRNWMEIQREEYVFERKSEEIKVLQNLTKQDIIDFWLEHEGSNQRKLSIQLIGNGRKEANKQANDNVPDKTESELENELLDEYEFKFIPKEGDATTIVDIKNFKENLHVYPAISTVLKLEDEDY